MAVVSGSLNGMPRKRKVPGSTPPRAGETVTGESVTKALERGCTVLHTRLESRKFVKESEGVFIVGAGFEGGGFVKGDPGGEYRGTGPARIVVVEGVAGEPTSVSGRARVSARRSVTIPADVLAEAGLSPGDEVRIEVAGDGRVLLARISDPVAVLGRYSGKWSGGKQLDAFVSGLRDEW